MRLGEEAYEVSKVVDARGTPENRFYKVLWSGYNDSEASWIHWRQAIDCQELVDKFWDSHTCSNPCDTIEYVTENRCEWCCKFYKTPSTLKAHHTRGCPKKPGSRAGGRGEKAILRMKSEAKSKTLAADVTLDGKPLTHCWNFKYLGYTFRADGDLISAILIRMAAAGSAFGSLHHVWRSKDLIIS